MGTTDNNNWTRVQQSVREAERLIGQKQYNLAMIKSRQALEFMVNCLGEKALIVDGDLADSINSKSIFMIFFRIAGSSRSTRYRL